MLKTKCGCDSGFKRCPEAQNLWRKSLETCRTLGFDDWVNSKEFADYREHMKAVYDQEHYYFNH